MNKLKKPEQLNEEGKQTEIRKTDWNAFVYLLEQLVRQSVSRGSLGGGVGPKRPIHLIVRL